MRYGGNNASVQVNGPTNFQPENYAFAVAALSVAKA